MTRRRFAIISIALIAALAVIVGVMSIFSAPISASAEDTDAASDGQTVTVGFVVEGKQYASFDISAGATFDFSSLKEPEKKADKKYTYSFGGWFLDEQCTSKFDTNQALWADTTLYAKFNRVHKLGVGEAAVDAVLGFIIVVGVLALLVGVFYVSGKLFKTKALSRENLFEFKKREQACEPAYVPEIIDDGGEFETVAAITAAIAVVLEGESGEKPEFVIRRITRKK